MGKDEQPMALGEDPRNELRGSGKVDVGASTPVPDITISCDWYLKRNRMAILVTVWLSQGLLHLHNELIT